MENNTGLIINVQRFTIHDGPGIRTEFFLKGCPLRCRWCSNPESYEKYAQIGVYPTQCIGVSKCGLCLKVCHTDALTVENDRVVQIDREKCTNCLNCQEACPSRALKLWGQTMTVEECMKVIRADRRYYEKSGGGVTLSGGEALLQWEFCKELFSVCRSEGIHTCLETALHVDTRILDEVLSYTDLVLTDLKHMDCAVHREQVGAKNELILKNLKRLADSGVPYILRVPVIPGFNDSEPAIDAISEFILSELKNTAQQIQVIRFRQMGEEKRASLGMENPMADVNPDRAEFEARIKGYVKRMTDRGLPAVAGSTTKVTETNPT